MALSYTVRTDKDTHFTGAIAQNASEEENVVLPGALAGIRGNARGYIRSITVVSDQQLAWELGFFSADSFEDADADVDTHIAAWPFQAADGIQIAATGLYRYYVDGLAIPYLDDDGTFELHVALINRSATGKNAGATGEVAVEFEIEPTAP